MPNVVAAHLLAQQVFRHDTLVETFPEQAEEQPLLVAIGVTPVMADELVRPDDLLAEADDPAVEGSRVGSRLRA